MNKITALLIIALGLIPVFLWQDGTVAVFTTIVGITMLLDKDEGKENRNGND